MGIQQVSATARYIDGNEHIVTLAEVGLASLHSVAASFRQACICRGYVAEAVITGDKISLKAVPFGEAKNRRDPYGQRKHSMTTTESPKPLPVDVLTARYLRSIPGTAQARELSSQLVQATRATP